MPNVMQLFKMKDKKITPATWDALFVLGLFHVYVICILVENFILSHDCKSNIKFVEICSLHLMSIRYVVVEIFMITWLKLKRKIYQEIHAI